VVVGIFLLLEWEIKKKKRESVVDIFVHNICLAYGPCSSCARPDVKSPLFPEPVAHDWAVRVCLQLFIKSPFAFALRATMSDFALASANAAWFITEPPTYSTIDSAASIPARSRVFWLFNILAYKTRYMQYLSMLVNFYHYPGTTFFFSSSGNFREF